MRIQTSRIRPLRSWRKVSGDAPLRAPLKASLRREDALVRLKSQEFSYKLSREALDAITRETQQIIERWDNRLIIGSTKLAERYVGGHLDIHIHVRMSNVPHIPGPTFPRHLNAISDERSVSEDSNRHDLDGHNEFPVLIDSVHIVDEPKRITKRVKSMMRLQTVDSCQGCGTSNALYLSTVTAQFAFLAARSKVGRLVEHREFNTLGELCLEFSRRELPCEMVKSGPEMVHDFASEHPESQLDLLGSDELRQVLPCFSIFISDNRLPFLYIDGHDDNGSGFQKVGDFRIEILDILIGPF
jgi:hypothetical protein